ncbi:esterase-like activity of phytase family protein [Sphingomonas solaris]|uniref:Autotransporter domain-containing protein n=1 Tax=Alterirhizorhabdus solaris TaxID=2529389 RepID=A0A558R1X7_9SPHN|nr:esterase-like activity of phytase family protein [Sphingomonas solaris]TVV73328.1 autotransporter domain-containing protein [Sphingomonas solaris]
MTIATRLFAASLLLASSTAALAQSASFTRPNITTQAGAASVSLGGQTFVNQGLVGVGRLDANTRDFAGETLGSFSGMALDLASWRRNADGTYSGRMMTTPDRGPNDVGPFVGTTDYRNRVHISTLTLAPYTGTAALPQATTSQNQLTITPTGGFFLTDAAGVPMTGKDPGTGVVVRDGVSLPSPRTGEGAGRISLDAEGIAYARDGSFYVSDEYAAGLYHYDATGRLLGAIQTVPALLPRTAGAIDFNSVNPPATGRRNNQGLEAVAITPDGNRLVTILQSATVQDTAGSNQATRNNTRVLVYDISGTATPASPIGHYVLQLPIFTQAGNGAAPDRTAAQSEMLALNTSQFLVLSRDGIGRGAGTSATNSPVFKSVLLIDTTGATNLAGTTYETSTTPIATNGALLPSIKPVQQVELVNMLNPVQLNRFGMNLNTAPSSATSLSEKQEAMGLAPVLTEDAPQDFFLLIGNDNDFQANNGFINGQPYNAALSGAGGSGNNDSVVLVYRLTLPTYVDPTALRAMTLGAPVVLDTARTVASELGSVAGTAAMERLGGLRRLGDGGFGTGVRLWAQTDWRRINTTTSRGVDLSRADGLSIAGGADYGTGPLRVGVAVGHQSADDDGGPLTIDAKGTSLAVYAGVSLSSGLYAQAAAAKTVQLDIDKLDRAGAYGLTGRGRTGGDVWTASGELGWLVDLGAARAGPFGGVDYVDTRIDGYTETGASLGNVAYQDLDYRRLRLTAGVEARAPISEAFVPSLRVGYTWEDERGDRSAVVRLASAQHSLATQTVALASTERDHVVAGFGVQGVQGALGYRFGAEGRFARGQDDARVSIGVSLGL